MLQDLELLNLKFGMSEKSVCVKAQCVVNLILIRQTLFECNWKHPFFFIVTVYECCGNYFKHTPLFCCPPEGGSQSLNHA